jgi:16S rRNA (cytosine967-C5)-methyltransferase
VKHSHPEWVARLWWVALGPGEAVALMAANNEPAEMALRTNTLRATSEEVRARLDAQRIRTRPAPHLPEGLVLDSGVDVRGSPLSRTG